MMINNVNIKYILALKAFHIKTLYQKKIVVVIRFLHDPFHYLKPMFAFFFKKL